MKHDEIVLKSTKELACKPIVEHVLKTAISARDSDEELALHVWNIELDKMGKNLMELTAMQLMTMIVSHKLSNIKSIERYRRAIQAAHPALRGEKWSARHDLAMHRADFAELGNLETPETL